MAKIYKLETYILDVNSNFEDLNDIIDEIDLSLDGCYLQPISKQETKEFEWHDDIDLNQRNFTLETYQKYFN